ncbi:hypothetical protein EDB85DRAFT_113591 [Lactarius pseudohatsudake]|nr:hypothetical protein EDB85DRAFT_113591 [Lactarius pseudohatsudake]
MVCTFKGMTPPQYQESTVRPDTTPDPPTAAPTSPPSKSRHPRCRETRAPPAYSSASHSTKRASRLLSRPSARARKMRGVSCASGGVDAAGGRTVARQERRKHVCSWNVWSSASVVCDCRLRTSTAPSSSSLESYFPASLSCGRYDDRRPSMPSPFSRRRAQDPVHDHQSRDPPVPLPLPLRQRPEKSLRRRTRPRTCLTRSYAENGDEARCARDAVRICVELEYTVELGPLLGVQERATLGAGVRPVLRHSGRSVRLLDR